MKTILWKELRENFKWALLGMIGGGLAMALALTQESYDGRSIASDSFGTTTAILCPIVGAALGLLQVIFESRQGYWAALVHRPISRQRIFLGKAVAGLLLYACVTLIPFGFSTLWALTPGNVAGPFRWGMVVPGLMDILTGTVYYFAGMLVARRSARWYASRCLPLVGAILCSILVIASAQLWLALLSVAIAAPLMLIGARGAFLASGAYNPQHWTAKSSQGAALYVGIVLAGTAAFAFVVAFMPNQGYGPNKRRSVTYQVLNDGRVVAVEKIGDDPVAVTDLDGNPLPSLLKQPDGDDPIATLTPTIQANYSLEPRQLIQTRYRDPYREMATNLPPDPFANWFYLPDTGRLEGYNQKSRRFIGSLGPSGLIPADQHPTDRFTSLSFQRWHDRSRLFVVPDGVYAIDLTGRTVEPLYLPEPGMEIDSYVEIWPKSLEGVYAYYGGWPYGKVGAEGYAIYSGGKLRLLDPQWRVKFTHVPDFPPSQYGGVTISELAIPGAYALLYYPARNQFGFKARDMPRELLIIGPDGERVSSLQVPANEYERQGIRAIEGFTGLILPPGPFVVSQFNEATRNPWVWYTWPASRDFVFTMAACLLIAGVLSLVVNLRLARRNAMGRGRRYLWTALGLLLGPSGVLLMLCLLDWPARERCESCGKARLVTRFNCEHCGVGFAPPPTDGTEVFDQPATALS